MPFKRRIGDGPEPALHQSDWHGEPCKFGEWAYLPAGKFSSDDDIQASGESDTAVCPPELKVGTPAHTKQLGWYV